MMDLVLCNHNATSQRKFLFIAPNSSGLCKGDNVKVETIHGIQPATVENVLPTTVGSEEYYFILDCCGATEPLKRVISREVSMDLEWEGSEYLVTEPQTEGLVNEVGELFLPFQ